MIVLVLLRLALLHLALLVHLKRHLVLVQVVLALAQVLVPVLARLLVRIGKQVLVLPQVLVLLNLVVVNG